MLQRSASSCLRIMALCAMLLFAQTAASMHAASHLQDVVDRTCEICLAFQCTQWAAANTTAATLPMAAIHAAFRPISTRLPTPPVTGGFARDPPA